MRYCILFFFFNSKDNRYGSSRSNRLFIYLYNNTDDSSETEVETRPVSEDCESFSLKWVVGTSPNHTTWLIMIINYNNNGIQPWKWNYYIWIYIYICWGHLLVVAKEGISIAVVAAEKDFFRHNLLPFVSLCFFHLFNLYYPLLYIGSTESGVGVSFYPVLYNSRMRSRI